MGLIRNKTISGWCLLHSFLLLVWLATPLQAAADDFSAEALDSLDKQLDAVDKTFQQPELDMTRLDSLTPTMTGLGQTAQACVSQYEQKQTQTQQAIDSLGKATPEEDAEVKRKRGELAAQQQQNDTTLSQCRLLSLQAATLLDTARKTRQELLKQQLFARTTPLWEYIRVILLEPGIWKTEITGAWRILGNLPFNWQHLWLALGYGFVGSLGGLFWSVRKRRQYRAEMPAINATSPTLAAVWLSMLRFLPYSLFTGAMALSLYLYPAGIPAVTQLILALLLFSLSYGVLHSLLRNALNVEGVEPADRRAGQRLKFWAQLLIGATLIGTLFHSPLFDFATPESPEPSNLIGLIRNLFGGVTGITLTRLIWLMSGHVLFIRHTRLHVLAAGVSLAAVASLWLGFRNFSVFLFTGVFGSLFLVLAAWLLLKIQGEIFDGLDEGRAPWQQRLRRQLDLKSSQVLPGLLWLRLTNTLVVGGVLLVLALRLWGMPEQSFLLLLEKLANGVQIAGFTLEPLRIISGLLAMAFLVSLTHVFKKHLAESWLRRTALSRGAREAITTISGYGGILLAILLGLAVAGIQFKNLAVIAGALSVGIGFGLQNIVNNFVSGLILLFERPIRRGDWIKVGSAEGYVRDISIRSTTIQTFDRSDIIVPNSEIISQQVTNMMLNDNFSRVIIPIGVAYGSDTEKVMEILRDAANAHPQVLKERSDMKVSVLFRSFGDNALNFELRCFIRDVETKLGVTSDLNLAIDKAFRQNSIDVPFPQRTIHMVRDDPPAPPSGAETPAKPADLG
ncbi:mechanosensitive ion channel domain-containing protein [Candidatus Thiothrix sp. Deng01]|uniref:Mechanosensitive ion channel domain-containing protein n=1 Tax=Candidatus Thiothrix phosphatis TaxID=3112415 RepID=A0ABU6CZ09_9GAMM|nr:mechanosensitive ion channel domain-containing protein [Candidatus Thiothrix sp. Deng01]MEB4592065.1 mechanosensitive ion channel domain-containing protein [Candidatus Thiothrix sp. Deng01]